MAEANITVDVLNIEETQALLRQCHTALWNAHLVLQTMYPAQDDEVMVVYFAVNDALREE